MGDTRTGKPMGFISEVEDEVIREAVSHKLNRHLVNPSNKAWRNSTQNKFQLHPFMLVTL